MKIKTWQVTKTFELIISTSFTTLKKFFCEENKYGRIKHDFPLLPFTFCIFQILYNKALNAFIFKNFFLKAFVVDK